LSNSIPRFFIRVYHRYELAVSELSVLLRVEAAQITHTDDCGSDFFHGGAIMPALVETQAFWS
jgi:hypothetical protein